MAQELRAEAPAILAENAADLEASRGTVSNVMLDRLALNEARLEGMAAGIEAVAALPRPGRPDAGRIRPTGRPSHLQAQRADGRHRHHL